MKKLTLNKETIARLDRNESQQFKAGINDGGECNATYRCDKNTGGCTDGCGPFATMYHCTDGHCTQNCTTGMTIPTEKELTSGDQYMY